MTDQQPTQPAPAPIHHRAHQHQPAANCDVRLQDVRLTVYPALVTCRACIALFTKDEQRIASGQATEPYDC